MKTLIVKSPAFENKKRIPTKYACDGDDVNPPLTIEGASKETRSLVLIIDDSGCGNRHVEPLACMEHSADP